MSKPYKGFEPAWVREPAPIHSFRSVFRWGDPSFVKYPKETLYKMMKERFELTDDDFTDGTVDILTLLVKTGLCPSRGDARRNVQQGGVTMGEEKVTDIARSYAKADFADGLVLRRGKKNYNKIIVK